MFSALISGRIVSEPKTGTSKNGNAWASATVAVMVDGQEAQIFFSVFTMDEKSVRRLEKAGKGASIAAQGDVVVNAYTAKDGTERTGWKLQFAEVMTVRRESRERPDTPSQAQYKAAAMAQRQGDLGDDLPWD